MCTTVESAGARLRTTRMISRVNRKQHANPCFRLPGPKVASRRLPVTPQLGGRARVRSRQASNSQPCDGPSTDRRAVPSCNATSAVPRLQRQLSVNIFGLFFSGRGFCFCAKRMSAPQSLSGTRPRCRLGPCVARGTRGLRCGMSRRLRTMTRSDTTELTPLKPKPGRRNKRPRHPRLPSTLRSSRS